jgi:hypothetical protein
LRPSGSRSARQGCRMPTPHPPTTEALPHKIDGRQSEGLDCRQFVEPRPPRGMARQARSQLGVHYGSIVDRFSDTARAISVGGGLNRRIDAGQCDADPVCVLLSRERASRVSVVLAARLGAWLQARRRRCRERGLLYSRPRPRTTGLDPRHRPVAWRKDHI